MAKTWSTKKPAEKDQRGRFQPTDIYATAARSAKHMAGSKPTRGLLGASEAHGRAVLDGDGQEATGAFAIRPKRT
jgi:hypothetical protein